MAEALPLGAQEAGGGATLVGKLRMADRGMVEVRRSNLLTAGTKSKTVRARLGDKLPCWPSFFLFVSRWSQIIQVSWWRPTVPTSSAPCCPHTGGATRRCLLLLRWVCYAPTALHVIRSYNNSSTTKQKYPNQKSFIYSMSCINSCFFFGFNITFLGCKLFSNTFYLR